MAWLRIFLLSLLLASRAGYSATVDLSRWIPEQEAGTEIEGDWDFYWGELWTPEDFKEGRVTDDALSFPIPAVWNGARIGDLKLKANHFATYRATIQWPESVVQKGQALTLSVPGMPGGYKLWLDGKPVIKGGKVGRNGAKEIPFAGSVLHTFIPDKTRMEIVLQVSSFHHRDGGVWWPLKVGLADHVTRVRAAGAALDSFALSCLFIMTFYHFGLWLMRPQYRAPLIFAIFCSVIAIRAAATGVGDLHNLVFPGMPQRVQKIMEYSGFYLGVPAYYAFVRELYPHELKTWILRVLGIPAVLLALSTLLLPVRVFTDFIEYYQVITLFGITMMLVQLLSAARNGRDGVGLLLFGTFIVSFASVNDILHAHRSGLIPFMVFPYGIFFLILCQSILLARRFSQAFHAVEHNEQQIQSLNAELRHQNAVLDSMVEEKTRDIRSIMRNIKQGIFTVVGMGTRIGNEFSDHLRTMVDAPQLKGGETLETILNKADMSRDRRNQITTVLANVVGEDSIAFDVNEHLLPRELRLLRGGESRLLEMDWSPIENEHTRHIEKILVSLRDVTDLRQLQEQSERNREELELIGEVLNVPTETFDSLIHSCEKFLRDCLQEAQSPAPDRHRLYRNMHTIKGVARSYGLTHLAEAAHHAEEIYEVLRNGDEVATGQLMDAGQMVGELLKRYDQIHRSKLGRKGHGTERILIDRLMIEEGMERLQRVNQSVLSSDARQHLNYVSCLFRDAITMPLHQLLHEILRDMPRLAVQLGKPEPEVVIHDPGLSIKPDVYDLFRNTFTHLLRNALDHGLETAAERQNQGKTARGRILIELRPRENCLEIFVSDDGRGLHLEAIQRSAQQRGLIASGAGLSDYEVANLIFAPGLSTKEQVTAVSGRGVGLDAVKNFLEQHSGDIDIQLGPKSASTEGVPFCFHITLPLSVCEDMQSVGGSRVASAS